MLIKVCGMRDSQNIREVEPLVDYMGFIFYEKSPRYVSQLPSYLPSTCKRVGVFVNATIDTITHHVDTFALDVIQLHGSENEAFCQVLHEHCPHVALWKAISIATAEDLVQTCSYTTPECFVFDTRTPLYGGSGTRFDWGLLEHYQGRQPFLLSGGISPENIQEALTLRHPRCIGLDLNSGFESAPAFKSTQLLSNHLPKRPHQ